MVLYSTKDEASGWKVYVTCDDCGYDRRVGWVKLSEVDHRDGVGELARKRARDYVGGE